MLMGSVPLHDLDGPARQRMGDFVEGAEKHSEITGDETFGRFEVGFQFGRVAGPFAQLSKVLGSNGFHTMLVDFGDRRHDAVRRDKEFAPPETKEKGVFARVFRG
jgi:hypothetical protein